MKALILAAGYATRLYPLTKEYPKPLLAIGKRHMIDYIVDKLEGLDCIDEIMVVTNSKFISKFRKWAASLKITKRVTLVDDLTYTKDDRRGAIGDMYFVIQKRRIDDDLLVVGGDNLFDGGLEDFLLFAAEKEGQPVIGVYNIKDKSSASQYGVVKLDRSGKIIDFAEKPAKPKSALVAMCLYFFPKKRLRLIKKYLDTKTDKHDATGFYIDWLSKTIPVYARVFEGRWYDIGHRDFYDKARKTFV